MITCEIFSSHCRSPVYGVNRRAGYVIIRGYTKFGRGAPSDVTWSLTVLKNHFLKRRNPNDTIPAVWTRCSSERLGSSRATEMMDERCKADQPMVSHGFMHDIMGRRVVERQGFKTTETNSDRPTRSLAKTEYQTHLAASKSHVLDESILSCLFMISHTRLTA